MKLDLDLHIPNDDFALKFYQGSNHKLVLNLYRDGVADTNISGYTATIHVYDSINDTSTYQIDSTSTDASAGTMTFEIAPGDLPPKRVYQGSEIIIKDGSDNPYFYADGTVTVRASILGSVASALSAGLGITWSLFSSYVGTATSGPYRAGTNVTFSGNADGSVDINATGGGGGATDLDDLTDVTITTPTELQALIYDGSEWVNGWPEVKMIQVRNNEGSTIPAGAPLYSKGEIGGSNRILVGIADANDSAKMPCIGIAYAEMNTTTTQDSFGVVGGVYNTNLAGFTGLTVGDTVYVKNWTGTPTSAADVLTITRPTDGSEEVQNVGIILKTNGTTIQGLLVSAIGRSNDIPNAEITTNSADADYVYIDDGNAWKKITPANLGIGAGDVSAASNIADNALVKGDGGAKGVQASGITCDDSNNVSGIGNITLTGTVDGRDVATDGSKLDGIATGAEVNSLPFGTWDYDSDLGTPGPGQFSTNNATASLVTIIKIHDNNSDGVDVSGITDLFNAGDYLYIQESGDSSTSHLYQIDSRQLSFSSSEGGSGQGFNVTHQSLSSNSTWTNGNACGIFYIHASETNNYLLDRANHTGTQTASTISDFDTEVSDSIDNSQAAITAITLTIDGAGSAITAGALGKFPTVPYTGEIESVEVAADQEGSIVIDIWKAADAIPTDTNSITGSNPATLSTAQRSQDETLTGWTTSIAAGDVLGFEVDSASTVTEVTLTIKVKKGN